ncbi:hypothetical protein RhiirA1_390694 [Rhizophagus irregularis]|uniref:Uncharacterized protein n=1 Tax=Rhizophagus irregularis TaxID=588596 RepID=A0A2N0S6T5_9GLOM|nr:hypothetical protein RhiirA1_390694 [Rhizophagus irregularis]
MECTRHQQNDGAELSMLNDSGKFSPRNDQGLRDMLHIFVSKNNLKFTVFIETPSKPFSDWSFPKRLEYSTVNLISPINELTEKGIDLEFFRLCKYSLEPVMGTNYPENTINKNKYFLTI